MGKEKQQYDSRTQKEKDESIAQIVKETMKAEKSTSSNDASSSASSNDTPNDTPNDVLSEFGDWAERMSINSDDVATTFDSSDSVTIVDVMDMYGQHVCEGCGLKDRPANWQGLCQACTDGGYKTTI